MQAVNLLNFDYEGGHGAQLCEEVLATLTALLTGNEASRRRLVSDVGYDQILTAVMRQVCPMNSQSSAFSGTPDAASRCPLLDPEGTNWTLDGATYCI